MTEGSGGAGPDGRRPRGAAVAERSSAGQTRVSWPGPVRARRAGPDLSPEAHTDTHPRPPSPRPRLPPLPAAHSVAELKPNLPPAAAGRPRSRSRLWGCGTGHPLWAASPRPRCPRDPAAGSCGSRPAAPLSARSRGTAGTEVALAPSVPLCRSARLGSRRLLVGSCGRAQGELKVQADSRGVRVGAAPSHSTRGTGRSHRGKGGKQTSGIRRRAAVKQELKNRGKDQSAG